jgi:hypothetical protein
MNHAPNRRDVHRSDVTRDSARIKGGNWNMQGLRRSGTIHDAGECQMSIAEFMAELRLSRDSDEDA